MPNRTVLIAGATGRVGREILQGLLTDRTVDAVHSLGRKRPAAQHPKLTAHVVDFARLPALPPVDEVYLALGTTIRVAGSQAALRAINYEANLAVAAAALAAGAKKLGLVSAMGADSRSNVFHSRVKGELEDALAKLPFQGTAIARPSVLVGKRNLVGRAVGFLIAAPINASAVAKALLSVVPYAKGRTLLLPGSSRCEMLPSF
ncbi:MAG TPA: NAD(P)H-binding protein [Ideonella sp.]|uniref:NAD(P)H-binding protein n=1 Tax=Ideonella sp. TaxID=1929293 RepID=UPI002E3086ED|nr:NAD(P)H-binding protein [Ideonella sp.]HEX5686064.1 NAD(P)H-binding protein [Ideonella sp.]